MKKLILLICFAVSYTVSKAENFTIDNAKIDQLFTSSKDVTNETITEANNNLAASNLILSGSDQTMVGYLVRAWFCGGFAIHRYYMGATGPLWAMYFCIPVVGGANACVDFWWVVFDNTALDKYKNNSKYMVWLD